MGNIHQERIDSLRALMRAKSWDAVIITGSDPHSSEYPAERWKQVEWLTGFSGEAGDVVITLDHAGLWTDSRYFIQAKNQLAGTEVVLHKTRVPDQVLIPQWLNENLDSDSLIAVDGLCIGVDFCKEIPGTIISVPKLLDSLWKDRPSIPQTPIFFAQSGESREQRIQKVRDYIKNQGCETMFIAALDEIAWTLNIRGSDIEYNPFVISYLLISQEKLEFFVSKGPIEDPESKDCLDQLSQEGICIRPYSEAELALSQNEGKIILDPNTINYHLWSICGGTIMLYPSPIPMLKAVKNSFEIEGMRQAHFEDGLALEKFLYWLEKSLENGTKISEWDASVKLGQIRANMPGYRGDSFCTISAYGSNAALPHYTTPNRESAVIQPRGLYLCDSGAQFDYGTTDITRTIPMGECSELEKEDYTLVLKGHINLAMAVFPRGTAGCQIDALAREALWRAKRNFGHGTGHGIGFFLGVHEGPHDIRQNFNSTALVPGMIMSNEPGIYREDSHGIRHENLMLCVEAGSNEFADWLCFETLSLCHIDSSALIVELLNKDEIEWLNSYNERVYQNLSPYLPEDMASWLREKTEAIG